MVKTILLILNTDYHVETTLGIYYSLLKNGYQPYIYLTRTIMPFLFYEYMRELNIACITDYNIKVDKYIVITYSPESTYIINDNHPIFKKLTDENTIYISHRTHIADRRHKYILGLSPAIEKLNMDFLYLCDHKFDDGAVFLSKDCKKTKFLVQGRLLSDRELSYLKFFTDKENVEVNFITNGGCNHPFNCSYINMHHKLSESDFYTQCLNCHYILPLVSKNTAGGKYISEKFTTSLSISWMFNKPMIVHTSLKQVYSCPGLEYSNFTDFGAKIMDAVNLDNSKYCELVNEQRAFKDRMHTHNKRIFAKYLSN
jgi:hypothetical protein